MTRLQAKDVLVSLGIEDPTDEVISNYLNTVNGEIQKEKTRAEQYKKESERAVELQKQLDELNSANLSDIEKANKATDEANNKIAMLEKQISTMSTKNSLISNGLSEEEADKFIESMNSGSFDASILGTIIDSRTKSAVADFEKKALENTPNPNGTDGGEPKVKTEMDKAVEIAKNARCSSDKSSDVIEAYK